MIRSKAATRRRNAGPRPEDAISIFAWKWSDRISSGIFQDVPRLFHRGARVRPASRKAAGK